jgi:hypothetical protein
MVGVLFQFNYLFAIFVSTAITLGLGGCVLSLRAVRETVPSLGLLGAYGLFFLGALSLLINFFLPLNSPFFALICVFSLIGWFKIYKTAQAFERNRLRIQALVLSIAVTAYWILGMRMGVQADTGLYHIPAIHWMHLSSLPIGLGQVHSRLATWNFWFSVCAGISAGNVLPLSVYAMNIALFGFMSVDFYTWMKDQKNPAHYFAVAGVFLISFLDSWYFMGGQKSPNADFAGSLMAVYAIGYFIQNKVNFRNWFRTITLLSGLAILIKLNQAPLGLMVLFAGIQVVRKKNWNEIPYRMIALVAFTACLMIVKEVWTTGCLLFPVVSTCTSLPWTIPRIEVSQFYDLVIRWGRWSDGPPELVLHGFAWIPTWWERIGGSKIIFCAGWALVGYLALLTMFRKKFPKLQLTAFGIISIALLYWFLSAPDLRFAYGFFALVFMLVFAPVLQFFFESKNFSKAKPWLIVAMLVSLVITGIGQIRKGGDYGMYTLVEPSPEFEIKLNHLGQNVWVPLKYGCWRLPVPCMPYFDPKVVESKLGIWTEFERKL